MTAPFSWVRGKRRSSWISVNCAELKHVTDPKYGGDSLSVPFLSPSPNLCFTTALTPPAWSVPPFRHPAHSAAALRRPNRQARRAVPFTVTRRTTTRGMRSAVIDVVGDGCNVHGIQWPGCKYLTARQNLWTTRATQINPCVFRLTSSKLWHALTTSCWKGKEVTGCKQSDPL